MSVPVVIQMPHAASANPEQGDPRVDKIEIDIKSSAEDPEKMQASVTAWGKDAISVFEFFRENMTFYHNKMVKAAKKAGMQDPVGGQIVGPIAGRPGKKLTGLAPAAEKDLYPVSVYLEITDSVVT